VSGDPLLKVENPPDVALRMQDGLDFERATLSQLADSLGGAICEIPDGTDRAAVRARTHEAMAAGKRVIVGGEIAAGDRVGRPDILIRQDSKRGAPAAYVPVDIKHHKSFDGQAKPKPWRVSTLSDPSPGDAVDWIAQGTPKVDDTLQLCHYFRILEDLGCAGDAVGGILGKEGVIVWRGLDQPLSKRTPGSALAIYDAAWTSLLAAITHEKGRVAGSGADPASIPQYQSACHDCPWRAICLKGMETADDITLVKGITPTRAVAYRADGIHTAADLANLSISGDLARIGDRLEVDIDQARVQRSGHVHLARGLGQPDCPRGDIEWDVDIEDDGDECCYLIGVLASRNTAQPTYLPYVSFQGGGAAEYQVFVEFWKALSTARSRAAATGQTFRAYCYSHHEETFFRAIIERHADRPGIPPAEELEDFLDSDDWVDLRPILAQLVWPTRDNSLKTLAADIGFSWRDQEAGGGNSMVWYRHALSAPAAKERKAAQERLLTYNHDDVRATRALRDWLTNTGPSLPSIETLDRATDRKVA
jgi:predicted RecB family nuclease